MRLSYWEKSEVFKDIEYCIIGAGIVGLNTALTIKSIKPQAKVLIVERGTIANGASTKNAGFACFGSVGEMLEDLETISEEALKELISMRVEGLSLLREMVPDSTMNFSISGGYEVFTKPIPKQYLDKVDYLNHLVNEASGLKNTFTIVKDTFQTNFESQMIFNAHEGQLHPVKMMAHLRKRAVEADILLMNGVSVLGTEQNIVTLKASEAEEFQIAPQKLLYCSNAFNHLFLQDEDIIPARNIVMVTNEINNLKLKGTFHYDKGYVYFRNIGNRLLIGGARNIAGASENTSEFGFNHAIIEHLKNLTKKYVVPDAEPEFEHIWSGIIATGSNKFPIIKKLSPTCYAGVRHGGMGVAIGSLTGKKLGELACNT